MNQAARTILRRSTQMGARDARRAPPAVAIRAYMVNLERSRHAQFAELILAIRDLGFDTLLLALPRHRGTGDIEAPPPIAEAAAAAGLRVHLDLVIDIASDSAAIVRRHPNWYRAIARRRADPRQPPAPPGLYALELQSAADSEAFVQYWAAILRRFADGGIGGYRCKPHGAVPPAVWQGLIGALPEIRFAVWSPGVAAERISELPRDCFDIAYNSLAWWDFAADWPGEEAARLELVAPVANTVGLPAAPASAGLARAARRLLAVAANNGHGLLLPMGFEFGIASDLSYPEHGADDWRRLRDHALRDLAAPIRDANLGAHDHAPGAAAPRVLSSEAADVAVLFEAPARLTVANRHIGRPATFDPAGILKLLDGRLAGFADAPVPLAPAEVRVFNGTEAVPIVTAAPREGARARGRVAAAAAVPRVAIEAIEPAIDGGRFAVKRIVGERVTVAADIFADGHGKIAAALQWRARDETEWHETPMQLVANDRWSAGFLLERVGAHVFRVLAWPDRFATWSDEVSKKVAAGLDVTVELEEGRLLLEAVAEAAPGKVDPLLAATRPRKTHKSQKARDAGDRIARLTGEATAILVASADTRPGQAVSAEYAVDADRRAAEFAAWYQLFPRNQTRDPERHGTFRDVIDRLPAIRDMGFDVLYFPPIHPIGRTNRKGRDNTLSPAPADPGSPYVIGAAEGGHDAIHPELGTLEDFHALRDAAAAHGLELALDFAIQCSPDHPWLPDHPEWFDWRPDGGLRYAENPPKKYEDIVNVDFYRPGAIPGLWLALRDVVAYWARQGVRIFRVDNPHTKPFAFWEWLIAEIRAKHPDALFLSEAFTRPKVMYRLAKLGFSQSYTYFTWRNEKPEIEEYLRELTDQLPALPAAHGKVADFFRPNFFVNTPDINPVFLQHAGRPGFLIRAALAATLSGLWGMLQGFEFCEAAPLPGREEYAHSDKYEIRARPERAPGDIVDEITRLNAIRRANPALQSHRGIAFHQASNDRVMWYRKENADRSNVVLVAVSLDPFSPQTANVEVPLWEWGLPDDGALIVTDLMTGERGEWTGKYRTISLDPRIQPFAIWRGRPRETL